MQCYTELLPPTAVTHSISLPLLSASANNLVVARSTQLQVFALKSILADEASDASAVPPTPKQKKERAYNTKLVLIGQYQLSGIVTGLGRVKPLRSKSGGEILVVAVKDAKLSLVQWDPEKYSITTVSIHYYEREDLQGSPWAPPLSQCTTYLTVDPGNRCAAYKFGARHLAILPFHQTGDDLAIDDFDPDADAKLLQRTTSRNEESGSAQTPYGASFVLSLLTLDPTLIHPAHIAFLYGYREPTLGILSSQVLPSSALLGERRDPINFTVYTLDLEQKASTSLLSVTGLPYDLTTIIPLPNPIGGTLLLGDNEIIHVDQSGKTNGIAVNEMASECTDFPLVSQSALGLKLEGCKIEQLSGAQGQMLMILNNGQTALLTFQTDGRTVSGVSVDIISAENGGDLLLSAASCVSVVGRGRMFIGSQDADSVVLGWTSTATSKRRVNEEVQGEDSMDSDIYSESEDENDLYADSSKDRDRTKQAKTSGSSLAASDYRFKIHDSLLNLAPLKSLHAIEPCFGNSSTDDSAVDLLAVTGSGTASALTRLRPHIVLEESGSLETQASRVWGFHVKSGNDDRERQSGENQTNTAITYDGESGESHIFTIDGNTACKLEDTDFEPDAGSTVEVAVLASGTRILQVLPKELRIFDGDFGLSQMLPIREDTEDVPRVVAATIAEPFIVVVHENHSVTAMRVDEAGDVEEIASHGVLANTQWQSAALYDDADDAFHLPFEIEDAEDVGTVLLFLLSRDGGLHVFRPPYFEKPLYVAEGLSFLPPYLTSEFSLGRGRSRSSLKELLVANLGDSINQTPYLILRTLYDDVVLYQPYQDQTKSAHEAPLQFFRTVNQYIPRLNEDESTDEYDEMAPLRPIQLASGLATIFVPGPSPRCIIKTASCDPKVISIKYDHVRYFASYSSDGGRDRISVVDRKNQLSYFHLPLDANISTGWVTQKMYNDGQIVAFDYHSTFKRIILGTGAKEDFRLPQDDELHPEWREETTSFLPSVDHDMLKLLDPATGRITDTYELDPYEVIMCIKVLPLEVSEQTHARREVVCVGTAIVRGEDLLTQGCIYVFDVIKVVPEPGHPETGRRLKLLAKVKDRGAVTAVSSVGSEGFLLVAHGQKCYVRGLKEDGTLLPVAFIDTQCYVNIAKELKGTNMIMLGDAVKGMWFVGYTEDPYTMKLFSKGANRLGVAAAEYLPDGEDLFILVVDEGGTLYTYKFDPSNPKSLSGQRLLLLSTFNTGSYPTSMTILPRKSTAWDRLENSNTPDPDDMDTSQTGALPTGGFQILCTGVDGSLGLITSLGASAYRTLAALQSYLTTTLPHPLALNPKAHRAVDADLSVGGRAVLDGTVLQRWLELGAWKRAESVARTGLESEWEVRALLESVGVRGMGYL